MGSKNSVIAKIIRETPNRMGMRSKSLLIMYVPRPIRFPHVSLIEKEVNNFYVRIEKIGVLAHGLLTGRLFHKD